MTSREHKTKGQIKQAPENFLSPELIADLNQHGLDDTRRGFLRTGFMAAFTGAIGVGSANATASADGDPAILEKQVWQTTLGKNLRS